ncbi:hypothetical protein F2P56_030384 [Juglans regia]|uniref:Histone H2A.v2-like n=2 Tax=Juglans regia TaxID=51240 RepID=A0A2I4G9D4_JUGRE|nr:histone H2A.v2-like [Juglans regia]KAF5449996.1 hypothetical protein F2P56_030384 [Juglans regia]
MPSSSTNSAKTASHSFANAAKASIMSGISTQYSISLQSSLISVETPWIIDTDSPPAHVIQLAINASSLSQSPKSTNSDLSIAPAATPSPTSTPGLRSPSSSSESTPITEELAPSHSPIRKLTRT